MESLKNQIQNFLTQYGTNGYQIAKKIILTDPTITEPIKQVLSYFLEDCWANIQHPALISLSCEAVGGKREAADEVSAGLVLLTGAADIHDDIMDKSKIKAGKLTPFGKFSQDTVLLAGDILLLKALTQLSRASEQYSSGKRQKITALVEEAFVEIGCATAKERLLKGNFNVDPKEYLTIIRAKGSVSDRFAQIGATIGEGKTKEVQVLGHFGRTLSVLMTLRNEFLDMQTPAELKNRTKNETLPLPILYALQDKSVREEIIALLKKGVTVKRTEYLTELVMKNREVQNLQREMRATAEKEINSLSAVGGNTEPFKLLLQLAVKDL
ncbi:MAG: polyprenyl synthetase family protein [Candidatus Bathyarchaeota archaeon]|nr:polyprenyl synthetase family protein [Candidatus Bathyarchaeota archaeon]